MMSTKWKQISSREPTHPNSNMNTFISHQTDSTQSYPMFLKTPHYIIVTINLGGFHEGFDPLWFWYFIPFYNDSLYVVKYLEP